MRTREQIKDRMIRTASRMWQIPEEEIQTTMDPLVLLMLDACAGELETMGYDLAESQGRLLDRLAAALLPDAVAGAQPAMAVMHATAHGGEPAVLNPEDQFTATQKSARPGHAAADVWFSPAGSFPVLPASLVAVAAGGRCWTVQPSGAKEALDQTATQPGSELYIGIAAQSGLQRLDHLRLYFDLRQHSLAPIFYDALPAAAIAAGGSPAAVTAGPGDAGDARSAADLLENGGNLSANLERQARQHFRRQFLTISAPVGAPGLPPELRALLAAPVVQKLEAQSLVWLHVRLRRQFPAEVWDALTVAVNALPVLNRRLHQLNYRTDEWLNIVPLQATGHLLDVHGIASPAGSYRFRATAGSGQALEAGEAMVRSSGAGRPSGREVRHAIAALMENIRNESALFADLGNDFIQSRLREVSQILTRIEDALGQQSTEAEADRHYVMLRAPRAREVVTIRYWTTQGALANGMKGFLPLQSTGHALVAPGSAYLLSRPYGGRETTGSEEKLRLLRRQVESRGRIISAADVEMAAQAALGAALQSVTVRRGVAQGAGPTQGFYRCIKVELQLTGEMDEETGFKIRMLEEQLARDANPAYPYRVVVA